MKLDISGEQEIAATQQQLWEALNDPDVLTKCIPGCKGMTEIDPDHYRLEMQLKVAAVGGSFEGEISLKDKVPPETCRINVSGEGSLGTGSGGAQFTITETEPGTSLLSYAGEGEVGGLVAGVGQRVLKSVSNHLIKQFFTALRKHFAETGENAKAG